MKKFSIPFLAFMACGLLAAAVWPQIDRVAVTPVLAAQAGDTDLVDPSAKSTTTDTGALVDPGLVKGLV